MRKNLGGNGPWVFKNFPQEPEQLLGLAFGDGHDVL